MDAEVPATAREAWPRDDLSLVALQGPKAEELATAPAVKDIAFMHYADVDLGGIRAQVSRSGYTGE
ncbi:MAG: hypothetical protein U1E16_04690 [Hyphomicrobiales bacterium]